MSSPAGVPMGNPQLQNQPPQAPPPASNNDSGENGMMVRPMRLKVLYTFDDECKTNCLARWPQVLQIQSIAMDEKNSIGVIDLYTCLQAIIECSPELLPRPGRDFTVYAYDFSEDDSPLVGQGMLSRALTMPPMPNNSIHQSQKLITGRVCKNIMGLFANGVKETLEVKLRLVPQTVPPMEYRNSMGNPHQNMATPRYDQQEWNSLSRSQENAPSQMSNRTPTPAAMSNNKGTSIEVVNQLLSPSLPPVNPYNQNLPPAPVTVREEPVPIAARDPKIARPPSRTTVKRGRRGRPPKNPRPETGGNTSGYEEGTEGEDGPAPKRRAKITQADWSNRSAFGSGSDSLRVTASTAGSIRAFRPLAPSGGLAAGNHLQEVPRSPTPVPILPQPVNQHRPQSQSGLRQGSNPQSETPQAHSPAYSQLEPSLPPEDRLRLSIESAHPSPEQVASPGFTPQDIASSPPVLRNVTPSIRSSPPCLSSPSLPPMPRLDSGFMSGNLDDLDDLFGEDDEISRPIDEEDIVVAKKSTKRRGPRKMQPTNSNLNGGFHIQEETPGPMELLPKRMLLSEQAKPKPPKSVQPKSRRNSIMSEDGQSLPPLKPDTRPSSRPPSQVQTAPSMDPPAPTLHLPTPPTSEFTNQPISQMPAGPPPPQPRPASGNFSRTASTGSMALPAIPANEPILPPTFQRSQTWSENPHYMTETPNAPSQTEAKKASIKQKLENALRNGQMPQYCENCGAIETPTWRRAWSQECQGAPGYHEYSEEAGRVTAINILSRDDTGLPTSYLLIKKALAAGEDQKQYKAFILCNPCGIWMSKYKSQRPEAKWGKDPDTKKKRPSKAKVATTMPTSEANFPQSEINLPPSDAFYQQPAAPSGTDRMSPIDLDGLNSANQISNGNDRPNGVRRANSLRPTKKMNAMTSDSASAALRRALQSSPARWTHNSHVEVGDGPEGDTTRRLLFPSPRKDSSPKVLGEVTANFVQIAVDIHNAKDVVSGTMNKENCSAPFDLEEEAELMRLIEEQFARPTTPIQKTPVANPFKTPTRVTPSHRPITRSVTRSSRSVKSASHLLAPPKTPSKTPGSSRRTPRGNAIFESPFTAQLNQLMSDNPIHSPSQHLDFDNLPDLPSFENGSYNLQQYDEDFFSTDVPMPSSPPRIFPGFNNTSAGGPLDWDNFGFDSVSNEKEKQKEKNVEIKQEPTEETTTDETA
ncbi:hypothetical protein SS1G_03252 [Sclerotinia sclerotiorum 1980 UF-70]|uniref:Ams2/SPT21 N-terminal domain-containing protein n=2 Tax=Sclerotinia sclerotiorum (strain ATCC 18683 / 1980 / Ss-1) TaxID=665079 RepID=A7ED62_SCLS1|nr:hypothetical protein SS1G_03252 [Sclerotinia sclerotiorum 1980 UF-70]APA11033.1 hypothetical protein sscle_07g058030 [Sclerotinia sclerotiorum 1980 UF-70]EDO00778.1 hypothetical protein SS1G_03252 [Sclerotinia sclerotiorum 1980 UF-70]